MSELEPIVFPEALQCLFQPARYKVLYGGRGGSKSWGAARALLSLGATRPIRVLCAREYQNSIKDSVHKLLSDQIVSMGLDMPTLANGNFFYDVQQASIKGSNGTEFGFEGIKHNVGKIKSYEGVDYCWVEEAVTVSKSSWDVLVPTIRKEKSEIWLTFNPELETDETYIRFVKNPPPNSIVKKITYRDNPWFPEVLREEMEDLKQKDFDAYLNVWEGECKQVLEGAVYMDELRDAVSLNRITSVPYDHTKPVDTFWDLGFADKTSIWFAQAVGFEYHLIDFYQNRLKGLDHYLLQLQKKGYVYGNLWLPHDAKAKSLGTGRSIEELARAKGFSPRIVPSLRLNDGINAARTIFPVCYFDKDKCADGINDLRHYRYDVLPGTGTLSRIPLHDDHSHAADAFRYFAIAIKQPKKKVIDKLKEALKRQSEEEDYLHGGFSPVEKQTAWMR